MNPTTEGKKYFVRKVPNSAKLIMEDSIPPACSSDLMAKQLVLPTGLWCTSVVPIHICLL